MPLNRRARSSRLALAAGAAGPSRGLLSQTQHSLTLGSLLPSHPADKRGALFAKRTGRLGHWGPAR